MYNLPSFRVKSPFDTLEKFRENMEKLFDKSFANRISDYHSGVFPSVNLTEDESHYFIKAELPGMSADELDIQIIGKSLTIAGERKIPEETDEAQYHRRERDAGRFRRGLTLPGEIESDTISAEMKNGILLIQVPKAETAKPKQIKVA
jgi:HSP20 family protein